MPPETDTGGQDRYSARCITSIHEVGRDEWDRLAGADNPFVLHDFLACLEDSGSASPETGWGPAHVLLEDSRQQLVGAAPAWFKSHSMGEYVFDQGLADAFERAGGNYYPKLLVAVPFTPVTGPRLLIGDTDAKGCEERQRALAAAIVGLARNAGVSSAHINFLTPGESRVVSPSGSFNGPESSSTGRTGDMRPSTDFWPACRRASARPSGASGARLRPVTSPSTG